MNLYEIPPINSLFPRRWLYQEENVQMILSTRRKLEDLEQRLQKIQEIEGKTAINYTKVLSTIGVLKRHIGVWRTDIYPPYDNLVIRMIYPNRSGIASWNSDILGSRRESDVCVVMLSSQCVEWLNKISHWVGE